MINNDEILFEWYKGQLGKYINSDNREINIQNRIIIPFLEKIFMGEEIEIVDTSTLYKNWNKRVGHDRTKYGGQYTPDILLASSNWDIYNENKNIDYYALFEVKVPTTSKGERTHAINECTDYLKHVNKVVLTNGISWEFIDTDSFMTYYYRKHAGLFNSDEKESILDNEDNIRLISGEYDLVLFMESDVPYVQDDLRILIRIFVFENIKIICRAWVLIWF